MVRVVPWKGTIVTVFLVIFLLGTFFRLYQLEEESLWVDEAFTDHYATASLPELITLLKNDVHPLLFYLTEQFMVQSFDSSEFTLRFIPFILGSLSIVVFFFLVRKLYGSSIALLATTFFSFSYTFILYSQEAKMYSQFIFFFFLVGVFYLRFLQSASLSDALWLAVFNALLVHTHILSFGILFLEIIFYVVSYRFKKYHENPPERIFRMPETPRPKSQGFTVSVHQQTDLLHHFFLTITTKHHPYFFALSLLLVGLTYLFWLPVFVFQFQRLFLDMLPSKFIEKLGFEGFYPVFGLFIIGVLFCCGLLYFLSGNKKITQKISRILPQKSPPQLFFFTFFLYLVVNLFFHQTFFGNIPYIRYLLPVVPLFYIYFSRELFSLPQRTFKVLICLYFVVTAIILFNYYTIDGKEQWREAAEYVEHHPVDGLVFHTSKHAQYAFNYYYEGNAEQLRVYSKDQINTIPPFLSGRENIYLVISHAFEEEAVKEVIEKQYQKDGEKAWIGITLVKYKKTEITQRT